MMTVTAARNRKGVAIITCWPDDGSPAVDLVRSRDQIRKAREGEVFWDHHFEPWVCLRGSWRKAVWLGGEVQPLVQIPVWREYMGGERCLVETTT